MTQISAMEIGLLLEALKDEVGGPTLCKEDTGSLARWIEYKSQGSEQFHS